MDRLILRNAQMKALARPVFEQFVATAAAHVTQHMAAVAASLGQMEVERGVRHALSRARDHGLDTERDLLRYVIMTFVFGRDFDVDPALPWAAKILAGPEPAALRTSLLQTAALRHEPNARGYASLGGGAANGLPNGTPHG